MSSRRKNPVHVETVAPAACSVDLRLSILQQLPFFASLPAADVATINAQFRERGFQSGETIYGSGEPATMLYVVASGQVRLLRHSPSGQDVLLDILQPGEYFGSVLETGAGVYPDTAQAQTAVCALSIRTDRFRALLAQYPEVALAMLEVTGRRLQEAREMVQRLSVDAVEQRLAAVLLKLAQKVGDATAEGLLIQMPLSREDLAQMIGSSTETVSRIMSQLQRDGVVRSGRQWVAIVDVPRMQEIAQA